MRTVRLGRELSTAGPGGVVRAEITACTDLDKLDTWLRLAVKTEKIEDVTEAMG